MTITTVNPSQQFRYTKWIVSNSLSTGTHTSIQAAINAAVPGDVIFIRDGVYTENFTLKADVYITSWSFSSTANVKIRGTVTHNTVGSTTISNMYFETNGNYAIVVSGGNASVLRIESSYINVIGSNGISYICTNAASTLGFYNCLGNAATAHQFFNNTSNGRMFFENCTFENSAASTVANSLNQDGTLFINNSTFFFGITSQGVSTFTAYNSTFNVKGIGNTALAFAGTTTATLYYCSPVSNTTTPISVTAPAQLNIGQQQIFVYTTGANYKVGDYIVYNESFYRVTTAISNAPALLNFGSVLSTTKELLNGSSNAGAGKDFQLSFGYNGSNTFRHYLKTRHNGNSVTGNGYEFFISDGTVAGGIATALPVFYTNGIGVFTGGWGSAYVAPTGDTQFAPKKYVDDKLGTQGGLSTGPSVASGRYVFARLVIGDYQKGRVSGTVFKQFSNGGGQLVFGAYVGNNPNAGTNQSWSIRVYSFADTGFGAIGNILYLYRDGTGAPCLAADFANNAVTIRFQYDDFPIGTLSFPWVDTTGYTLIASTTPTLLTTYDEFGGVIRTVSAIDPPVPTPSGFGIP